MQNDHLLEQIIMVGRMCKGFEVKGFKFELRTLSSHDMWDIVRESSGYDQFTQMVGIKIKTLARSLTTLNGKSVEYVPKDDNDTATPEKLIKQNEEIIGKWQNEIVNLFYNKYDELASEQTEFLKQSQISSKDHGVATSGKSPN